MKRLREVASYFVAILLFGMGFAIWVQNDVISVKNTEISEWQDAVKPIFESRGLQTTDPALYTPDKIRNLLNPCFAATYRERGRYWQRGCYSGSPFASVMVRAEFINPKDRELTGWDHL